jgi:hypothetical protein
MEKIIFLILISISVFNNIFPQEYTFKKSSDVSLFKLYNHAVKSGADNLEGSIVYVMNPDDSSGSYFLQKILEKLLSGDSTGNYYRKLIFDKLFSGDSTGNYYRKLLYDKVAEGDTTTLAQLVAITAKLTTEIARLDSALARQLQAMISANERADTIKNKLIAIGNNQKNGSQTLTGTMVGSQAWTDSLTNRIEGLIALVKYDLDDLISTKNFISAKATLSNGSVADTSQFLNNNRWPSTNVYISNGDNDSTATYTFWEWNTTLNAWFQIGVLNTSTNLMETTLSIAYGVTYCYKVEHSYGEKFRVSKADNVDNSYIVWQGIK